MHLNDPKCISPLGPSTEKLCSMKPVPGAKKIRVCCPKAFKLSPKKRREGFPGDTVVKSCLSIQDT